MFGGSSSDIDRLQHESPSNIIFFGSVDNSTSLQLQSLFDVLLMPYQYKVSIGTVNSDTSRWMSPMKMFEYMASGVPIVSSDLPALKEILVHHHNCLLSPPDDISSWLYNIDYLFDNPVRAAFIGNNAHNDYRNKYTWSIRASAILNLFHKCN